MSAQLPITSRLGIINCLIWKTILITPAAGFSLQVRYQTAAVDVFQAVGQQVSKQVVIAVPLAAVVEWDEKKG